MFDLPTRVKINHTFSSASAVSLRGLAERSRGGEIEGWHLSCVRFVVPYLAGGHTLTLPLERARSALVFTIMGASDHLADHYSLTSS
jgi:hypothetical protein